MLFDVADVNVRSGHPVPPPIHQAQVGYAQLKKSAGSLVLVIIFLPDSAQTSSASIAVQSMRDTTFLLALFFTSFLSDFRMSEFYLFISLDLSGVLLDGSDVVQTFLVPGLLLS